jgi:hypothetical protein
VRHATVTEVIHQLHDESHQTYGARRLLSELMLGEEMTVACCTVEFTSTISRPTTFRDACGPSITPGTTHGHQRLSGPRNAWLGRW